MTEYLKREDVRRAVLHNEGDAVIAAIDELPVTELQGWIPVTERLPENDDPVLVYFTWKTFPGGAVAVSAYHPRAQRWETDWNITHWMPLPQPPEV